MAKRLLQSREPLSWEIRCGTCQYIRPTEMYSSSLVTCDCCLMKLRRYREGLWHPQGQKLKKAKRDGKTVNAAISNGTAAGMAMAKFNKEEAEAALALWKRQRRAELAEQNILYGDAARVVEAETRDQKMRLGLLRFKDTKTIPWTKAELAEQELNAK